MLIFVVFFNIYLEYIQNWQKIILLLKEKLNSVLYLPPSDIWLSSKALSYAINKNCRFAEILWTYKNCYLPKKLKHGFQEICFLNFCKEAKHLFSGVWKKKWWFNSHCINMVREITFIKLYNFRIKSGMYKLSNGGSKPVFFLLMALCL